MSDSDTPQPDPQSDGAPQSDGTPDSPVAGPANGSPEQGAPVAGPANGSPEQSAPVAGPANGSPEQSAPRQGATQQDVAQEGVPQQQSAPEQGSQQGGESPVAAAAQPPVAGGDASPAVPPLAPADGLARVWNLLKSRRGVWAAVAVVCVAAGVVASVLGARAVARNDGAEARQTFARSTTGIATALKLAIQREEELAVSASTYYARNPQTSPAEFDAWAKWARTTHRFPELESLGLMALVRAPELAAYQARITGHAAAAKPPRTGTTLGTGIGSTSGTGTGSTSGTGTTSGAGSASGSGTGSASASGSATPGGRSARIVPASNHLYYCLAVAELTRNPTPPARTSLDYCALTPGPLLARDAGLSSYTTVTQGHSQALEVITPVYRANVTPLTAAGRAAASVGWMREVLAPGVVLRQVLQGHPGDALRLRYKAGSSNVAFTSGAPQSGAQSATMSLHNSWSVRIYGASAGEGVFENGNALALLIGGSLLSALAGLLVFVLGAGGRTPAAQAPAPKAPRAAPSEELYDALTGLPNRALTLDRAAGMVARAGRQSGMLAGALFIDVDWFRDVNEKLGQEAGDQLLKIVAQRLEDVVRAGDTVGRQGEDEFVVLVESAARGARLDSLARRVIEALHKPVELDGFGPSFYTTASIGVAFGRYTTPEDLLRDARLALNSAKAAGKDRYTLFNANMRSVIESRGMLEAELNTALEEKQFDLLYEPIYDLGTRKVVGLESLIRWRHPKRGVLDSVEFIPLAEETGLIVPIGRWALEEACNRGAMWNVTGHRIGISVKVSDNQLNREGFVTDIRRALQQSGMEPSLLTIEIAETTVMRDLAAAAERLREIKQLGVRVAIDDFGGSGYARHSDLRRVPLDCLKVDRSSLAASDDEDYRSWLLEAILIVGRDMSLTVIATGIETHEQLTTLRAMGCAMAQGPALGQPTSVDAVEGLFNAELPAVEETTSSTTTVS